MIRDQLFRKWYDERLGVKSEGFAYDVWCAAWNAALSSPKEYPKPCECVSPLECELNDKCYKQSKDGAK